MWLSGRILWPAMLLMAFASPCLKADKGDAENSHDYPGLPRIPGFVITDYSEDNPAEFSFPIAKPTSTDSDHVDNVRVSGHRYVIRYEVVDDGLPPTLLQIQQYYEKLAKDAGFKLEKTGAVGDVTETFHLSKEGHDLWVHLDPSIAINILTIVEANGKAIVIPTPEPSAPAVLPAPTTPVLPTPMPDGEPMDQMANTEKPPDRPTDPDQAPDSAGSDDVLYRQLLTTGHVVLPITFQMSKSDLASGSQAVIDRVIAIMKQHPELRLEIAGHTDGTGDAQTNQMLSTERALTVRDKLVEGQVDKDRLVAMGMGGTQPLADDNTAAGRAKNRRIELVMLNDAEILRREAAITTPAPPSIAPDEDTPDDKAPVKFYGPAPNGINYYPKPKKP